MTYLYRLRQNGKMPCLMSASVVSFRRGTLNLLGCHHFLSYDGGPRAKRVAQECDGWWVLPFKLKQCYKSPDLFFLNPQASEAFPGYNSGGSGKKRVVVTFVQ